MRMKNLEFPTFYHFRPDVLMVRVLGFGVWVASYEGHRPLFSERNGYTKAWPIFPGWRLVFLAPWK